MSFKPGQSGNPGGMPGPGRASKQAQLVGEAVERATKGKTSREEALGKLLEEYARIALDRSESTKDRLGALQELLDRSMGKVPNQNLNLDLSVEVKALTNEQLEARISSLLDANPELRDRLRGGCGTPGGTGEAAGDRPAIG